ncbi:MAG: amino acid adenylation domain-containing protein, partial [Cyanobacteria bacterium P01_D01_bin.56]
MAERLSSIYFLFEAYAKKYPKAVAVDGLGEHLTYAALNGKANQLAHYLITQGIGTNDLVGVCLERSCGLIVSILGILKAGAAYVPLDPSYPTERLAYMLEQAEVGLILTQANLVSRFATWERTCFCLDTHADVLDKYPTTNPNLDSSADQLGYLIYTSGSTGKPKGVAMPQGALQNLIRWQLDTSVVTTGKTLQFTPISFDVSFQEIFATLSAGGTLVLISDDTRRDPYGLIQVLQQQSIERLYLPFVALQQLAEVAVSLDIKPKSLREVITAGEQLRITPALTQWFSQMPQCRLHNHYGPSESHVVTAHRLSGDPGNWPVLPPIGQPIDNVEIHLLDPDLEPVESGEIGEIFIGGACLARGYLGRPSITAERFIQSDLGRIYKTGDLARCLPNGDYEYLGRSDQQVKIRGYRVELGEIESALDRQPAVKEAVVIAKEEPNGHRRLVGYVVAQGRNYDAKLGLTLRQALGDCLPDYMVPSQIVCLEAFPLTPSGKIDRRNLPDPIVSGDRTAPETPLEKALVGIWSKVLNVPSVGIHQTFFELGGDSLLATQVLIRIRAQLEYELPIQQLFDTPTVHTLAQWLLTHQMADAAITIHPADRSQPLPLAWVQETLWFLDQLIPDHPFYNVPEAFRLEGAVNTVALQKSLQAIVDRHETLRTTFDAQTGRPLQVVHSQVTCPFEVIDLSALSTAERETEIETHLVEAARVPFDLSKDVLLRGTLFKLATDDHVLLLNLHHIVCDGWSVSVLIQELTSLYTAFSTNQSPSLPDLPLQFGDFSQWHRQWLTAEMYDQQLTYWKDRLGDGVPMLELPRDFPRPVMPSYEGGRHFWSLPKQVTQQLKALSQETGTTLYMTLLAAFQTLLHRYSGQDDIAVGSLLANRPHPDLEKLIGFFPNTVVMRTDMS